MRFLLPFTYLFTICLAIEDYQTKRAKLLRDESTQSIGGKITLTDNETLVNNCLMQLKFREVDYGFENPQYYNFSRHYFAYKDDIRKSKVYKIIRDMPKGAALHIHDMGILDPDYVLNITYRDNLYVCFGNDRLKLKFSHAPPDSTCRWQLMKDARFSSENVTKFDADLQKHFSICVDDPDIVYPSIKEVWGAFTGYFVTVAPMMSYRPVWEQYFYDVLKKFREDNIMYVEVRSVLLNLYELDGTVYDPLITAKTYQKAYRRFIKDYPDFIGAKLIYAPPRNVDRSKLAEYLNLAYRIKENMSDFFAGFDLVGQEDVGSPLVEFIPQLSAAAKDFNFFFHAGETDWYGTFTDENLVDAILLGAKRIGHAYALPKHPMVMKAVVENDIGLEVNVISNAVLALVRDIRNHPLSTFIAQGLPVVLSSDDPGIWQADPLSDDFYVAFVGVASRLSDLRLLKQLAINSLKYSALEHNAKTLALNKFNRRWNEFIENFNCSKY
ncbi:adenosine deaminase 2-like [Zerene cesonia]|uniref:adenosine deaminase 2-like n=1 Tax=Zerene cesonia TaxID=33412 RepID=UPI0018E58D2C|nr:adenosine deaminase 2-like [Zerene cesonia]